MDVEELLRGNRSYRRFHEDHAIDEQTLVDLVALTRLCPSGANRQPLRFMIAHDPQTNAGIFPHLGWAKWLPDWSGPAEGERPSGYVVVLGDRRVADRFECDAAIAAFAMLLGATQRGLGGCMIGWVDREKLTGSLRIPDYLQIVLVVALGKPKETVVLEDAVGPNNIGYWRDPAGVHHVPKRSLDELIIRTHQPSRQSQPALA